MTEGSEKKAVTVNRSDGGPLKVGDKSPKVEVHCTFKLFIQIRAY